MPLLHQLILQLLGRPNYLKKECKTKNLMQSNHLEHIFPSIFLRNDFGKWHTYHVRSSKWIDQKK